MATKRTNFDKEMAEIGNGPVEHAVSDQVSVLMGTAAGDQQMRVPNHEVDQHTQLGFVVIEGPEIINANGTVTSAADPFYVEMREAERKMAARFAFPYDN